MQGWIKIHRILRNHWLYEEKREFSRLEAWLDLLLEVNHADNKFLLGIELVEVKAGQTVTSIRKLCHRWRWSNSKVVHFLNLLQKDGMVQLESDTKKTTITIVNYGFYQSNSNLITTQKSQLDTASQTEKHTNKNVKNEEKEKKDNYSVEFEQFWNSYPRRLDKKKAYVSFNRAIRTHSFETIMNGTEKYALQVKGNDKQYVKHPTTFLNNDSFIDGFEERGKNNESDINAQRLAREYNLNF